MSAMAKWWMRCICSDSSSVHGKLEGQQPSPAKSHAKESQISFEIHDPKHLENFLEGINKAIDRARLNKLGEEVVPKIMTSNIGVTETILDKISQKCQTLSGSQSGAITAASESYKVLCDVLRGAGNLHWAAAGLSMLAFVLDRMDMVSKNDEECMNLLMTLRDLGRHVVLLYPQLTEQDEKLRFATRLITAGSILCCNYSKAGSLKRFAFSGVSRDDFGLVRREIEFLYPDLILSVNEKIQLQTAALLRQISMPLSPLKPEYPSHAVGLDEKVDNVLHILGMTDVNSPEPGVRGVVLHGMGGIGKSTLGMALHAKLPFVDRSHAKVAVGKLPTKEDIRTCQINILERLSGKKPAFGDCEEGRQKLRICLQEECTSPTLLIIDNVFNGEDLEELLPEDLVLPDGSRIIVTSRDVKACAILEEKGVPCQSFHVSELGHNQARELLCLQVFNSREPPPWRENSVNSVLNICGGLPLALEVVGRYLRRHNNDGAWTSVIQSLQEWRPLNGVKEDQLTQCLMFSYDQLSEDVQRTFLDITSLLWDIPWDMIEPIYGEKLVILEELALVKRIQHGDGVMRPQVHDLLLALGRSKEPGKRVTPDGEDLIALLEDDNVDACGVVEGLFARNCKCPLSAEKLDAMHKSLRTLILQDVTILGNCTKIPRHLQLCITTNGVPYSDLAELKKLQVLIISNEIVPDLETLKFPRQLRVLILVDVASLTCLPGDFGELRFLRTLEIDGCRALQELPDNFDRLECLWTLVLSHCEKLRTLPRGFERLKCLQTLKLCYCGQLLELPEGFGQLQALENLDLCGCKSLKELPIDFSNLRSLRILHLGECESLTVLPQGFGNLQRLQELNLTRCDYLDQLPEGFEDLTALQALSLEHCQKLSSLPANFSRLSSLEILRLSYCRRIDQVPADFLRLPRLRFLDVSGCQLTNMGLLEELRERRQCRVVCENIDDILEIPESPYCVSPEFWFSSDEGDEEEYYLPI